MQRRNSIDRYLWIIGGGLMQVPLVLEAQEMGLNVVCSDLNPDCACSTLAEHFFPIDIFDVEGHVLESKIFAETFNLVGVLAAGIDAPETMAVMADKLGLPGVSPDVARLVQHKAAFRKHMKERGFPTPKFLTITSNDIPRIEEMCDQVGYPLVIKNTDSSGSRGVSIFYEKNVEKLKLAGEAAIAVSRSGMGLIESFWEGDEQTVEAIIDVQGVFRPCFITDRLFDKSSGFAIETGLRHPSALSSDDQSGLFDLAKEVALSLGIDYGTVKLDTIFTEDGPRIIEMTVRSAGGFDPQYLVPAATGKNILRVLIHTAIGEQFPPRLLESGFNRIGVTCSMWPTTGTITDIKGLEEAGKIDGIFKIIMNRNIGDIVENYKDCTKRVGFIIATGESEVEACASLENALSVISVETRSET